MTTDTETKLAEALREAEPALWLMAASGNQDAARIHKTILDALAAHDTARAQPASVAELQLTQLDRESLNYLGSALKHKPHAEVVDKALVICDHYARRAQLTICHEKLHERMLAAAPQPQAEDDRCGTGG